MLRWCFTRLEPRPPNRKEVVVDIAFLHVFVELQLVGSQSAHV